MPQNSSQNERRPASVTAHPGTAVWLVLLAAAGVGIQAGQAQTQTPTAITPISLTASATDPTVTGTYTQDFNILASTGTASTVPAGFGFTETGSNANATYSASSGTGTPGDTYSFGNTPGDRAFGSLQTGSLASALGAVFTNNTGSTLTSLTISFTGEQWRLGALNRTDRLDFQLSPSTTSLTTGTFTDYDALDFTSPVTTGTVGALNGNVAPNRTAITATITGLTIADGQSFAFRFVDFDATGSDDGTAIDDLSLSGGFAGISPVPEPTTVLGGILLLGAACWNQRGRLRGWLSGRLPARRESRI